MIRRGGAKGTIEYKNRGSQRETKTISRLYEAAHPARDLSEFGRTMPVPLLFCCARHSVSPRSRTVSKGRGPKGRKNPGEQTEV